MLLTLVIKYKSKSLFPGLFLNFDNVFVFFALYNCNLKEKDVRDILPHKC